MNFFFLGVIGLLSFSCAIATRQTDQLVKDFSPLPSNSKLADVPLVKQASYHCGPASLSMAMQQAGREVSFTELNSQVLTPHAKGSFKTDMLASIRRQGMLAIAVKDLKSILSEVSSGRAVIVFQNLGLSWWPRWHYAVVTGYDFSGPDIILHTGDKSFLKTDMRIFERSWILGGHWAYVILSPGEISTSASERIHAEAASQLETIGKNDEAQKAYESMFVRWPESLPILIGLGNVSFTKKQFKESVYYLEKATSLHPLSAIAWHNLAFAQEAEGKKWAAQKSALKAIEMADEEVIQLYRESLKDLLP